MKIKKGLGSIPKSLAWIDWDDEEKKPQPLPQTKLVPTKTKTGITPPKQKTEVKNSAGKAPQQNISLDEQEIFEQIAQCIPDYKAETVSTKTETPVQPIPVEHIQQISVEQNETPTHSGLEHRIMEPTQTPAQEMTSLTEHTLPAPQASPILTQTTLLEETLPTQELASLQSTSQKGLPSGWTRATFIVDQELNEQLKAFSYWERVTVKEIVHVALKQFLQGREIKPIPQKRSLL